MTKKDFIVSFVILSSGVFFNIARAEGVKPFPQESLQNCFFQVSGMTCTSCGVTLKAAVKKLPGIKDIKVYFDNKRASVIFIPGLVSSEDIAAKINELGYKAELNQCKSQS